MEIFLDKRAVKQIRISAKDAVDEGESDTLREDITQAFSEEQVEEIERRIDNADFTDFVSDVLDEWSGEEVDELFELLEGHLSEAGVDIKYAPSDGEDDDADDDSDDDDDDDDDDEEGDDVAYVDDQEDEL